MLIQAATEAAKSSSAIFLDGVAIMALIGAGGLAIREYFKSRQTRRNGNNNSRGLRPGMASECIEHKIAITRIDTEQKNIISDILEIKGDIKTLLRRVPPRD